MAELGIPAERDETFEFALRRWESLIRATAKSYVIPGRLEEEDLVQEACIALNEVVTEQVCHLKWWSVDSEDFGKYFKTKLYHTWTDSVRFERSARRNPSVEVRSLEDSEDDPVDSLHSKELTPEQRIIAVQFAQKIRSRLVVLVARFDTSGKCKNVLEVKETLLVFDLYVGANLPDFDMDTATSQRLDDLMKFVRTCQYCNGRGVVFDDCCTCLDHETLEPFRKVTVLDSREVQCPVCVTGDLEDCCTCLDRKILEPTRKVKVVVGEHSIDCPVCICRCKGTGLNPNPSRVTQTQIQEFLGLKRVRGTEIFWLLKQAAKTVDASVEETCHAFLHVFGYPRFENEKEHPFLVASCNLKDGNPTYTFPAYTMLKGVMVGDETSIFEVFHQDYNGVKTSVRMHELARKVGMTLEDLRRAMDSIRIKLEMIDCGVPLEDIPLYV